MKKAQARIWKFFFQLSNLSQSTFLLENPTHWALETAVCPIFAKPVLDIFTVFSLVPRMNLSQSQQGYLCQKNQNYLLEKAEFMFFFSYGLRTSIKITTFNTFYVTDVLSCYSRSSCKKIQTLSKKLFFQKNLLTWSKCYWSYKLYHGKEKTRVLWNSTLKNI